MPRAGLNTAEVVAAGAELADLSGIGSVSLATLAERLGVRPPALYKHVEGLGDLHRRIAVLAMNELADELSTALQGRSGRDAIEAMFGAISGYIAAHPGRYAATTGAELGGPDDPLRVAAGRLIGSIRAVLSGFSVPQDDLDHAIRTLRCLIHGYALLASADAFQWSNDPRQTLEWMIRFVAAGLKAV